MSFGLKGRRVIIGLVCKIKLDDGFIGEWSADFWKEEELW